MRWLIGEEGKVRIEILMDGVNKKGGYLFEEKQWSLVS